VRWHPDETKKNKGICSVCKKPVTVGVLSRVGVLANRAEGDRPPHAIPYKSLVPLDELIAEALDRGHATKGVQTIYEKMMGSMSEFDALLKRPYADLSAVAPAEVVEAIRRMREGKLIIEPGFDGEYGTVKMFSDGERKIMQQKSLL
jgi:PHP family Zn ribbon phosphoesterase